MSPGKLMKIGNPLMKIGNPLITLVALAVLSLSVAPAYATSTGIIGRSTLNTPGCGPAGCHASSANTTTTVRIAEAVNNSITVARGQKIRLTLVVEHATRTAAGCDISVKTALNGSSNGGTLTTVVGEGLKLSAKELTHTTPKFLSSGSVSFAFDWTAPDADGTFFLHAIANAVNRNGSSDPNDIWNFLTPVQLVVSGTNGVSEFESGTSAHLAPQPAHSNVHISASVQSDGEYQVNVFNLDGILLFSDVVTSQSNFVEYDWHGRDSHGFPVPSGSYPFNITGSKAVFRGSILISR